MIKYFLMGLLFFCVGDCFSQTLFTKDTIATTSWTTINYPRRLSALTVIADSGDALYFAVNNDTLSANIARYSPGESYTYQQLQYIKVKSKIGLFKYRLQGE